MARKSVFLATIVSFFLFFIFLVPFSFATVTPPEFPSCVNPQGTVRVSYSSGTHGVPGVATSYQGSDTVYNVSDNSLIQCLCTIDGEGIQTNWWKVPQLSSDEIENFKTLGWNFIPDGSAWGLDPAAYLAKNSSYSCRSSGSGGESSSNSSSNSNNGSSVGGVSSIGDILGLAATGNIRVIYGLFFTGFLSLLVSYFLDHRHSGKRGTSASRI